MTRRASLGWVGLGVVLAALPLVPLLTSPIMADSTYSYFVPEWQFGSPLEAAASAWTELPYTASFGRVAPVSWMLQWLQYWAGLRLATATSLPLELINGMTKFAALGLTLLALWAYLRQVRLGGGDPRPMPAPVVRLVVITTMLVFSYGARLDNPFRNALTSYPVFTVLGAAVVLALPALALAMLSRLERGSPGEPWVSTAVLGLGGVMLGLSYELWYVAAPATVLAIALQPVRRGAARARLRLALAFGVPFLVVVTTIRVVLHWTVTRVYMGLDIRLDPHLLTTTWHNLANSIPGGGADLAERTRVAGLPPPPGWSLSWALVAGLAVVVVAVLAASARRSARDAGVPRREAWHWGLRIGALLVVSASAAAVIMAVSRQSQEYIGDFNPFRNYVITWGSVAAGIAVLAAVLVVSAASIAPGIALVAAFLLIVGPVQAPRIALWTQTQQVRYPDRQIQRVHDLFTHPLLTPMGEDERCAAVDGMDQTNRFPFNYIRSAVQGAFERMHGVPYCTHPEVPIPEDAFRHARAGV